MQKAESTLQIGKKRHLPDCAAPFASLRLGAHLSDGFGGAGLRCLTKGFLLPQVFKLYHCPADPRLSAPVESRYTWRWCRFDRFNRRFDRNFCGHKNSLPMPKYVVRHGVMRNLGVFYTRGNDAYARSQQVIAR